MGAWLCYQLVFYTLLSMVASAEDGEPLTLPAFRSLARVYPGYAHHGGRYHHHQLLSLIGPKARDSRLLLHDTSALRLSFALNRVGGVHSLGRHLIRLSKFGHDSISGADGLEYIFHPIAYGPYLADKYGYPSVSKLHAQDPVSTKEKFWGRQGILRVITYTRRNNMPKGHVALWDCNHFHQSQDWVATHTLLTVEFWESPDSNCSLMNTDPRYLSHSADLSGGPTLTGRGGPQGQQQQQHRQQQRQRPRPVPAAVEASRPHPKLRHKHWERRFLAQRRRTARRDPQAGSTARRRRSLDADAAGPHVHL